MGGEGKKRRKKKKRLKWLVRPLEYAAVLIVVLFTKALPFRAAMWFGGFLAGLAYKLDARHRRVINENLARCLKDRTPGELAAIAESVYRNLGYSAVEFIRSDRYANEPLERHFRLVNYEAFQRASDKGKGVVLLTAHCGSWEIMAMYQALLGNPFGVVVRPLDNPYLDRAVERIRSRYGNVMIDKNRGMREVLRTLSDGRAVGILLDQNVSEKEGVFVDFFGMPACTNKGLALIALKTGVPVIPAFIHRTGFDMHEVVLGNELPLINTGDKESDVIANTQMYTKEIEGFIRKYPDQWFWMHRRWKTVRKGGADA